MHFEAAGTVVSVRTGPRYSGTDPTGALPALDYFNAADGLQSTAAVAGWSGDRSPQPSKAQSTGIQETGGSRGLAPLGALREPIHPGFARQEFGRQG